MTGGPLRFADTWVGTERTLELELTNPARATQLVSVQVDPPFFLNATGFELAGGATERVPVVFRPASVGLAEGLLLVGASSIEVRGVGVAIPACEPTRSCQAATFDLASAQCLREPQPDGTACTDQCVTQARCLAGACVGAPVDCSDRNACTVDACGPSGCTHTARVCPAPTNPCKAASCDPVMGCVEVDVDDGVVCGSEACTEPEARVCVAGQCVLRPRPLTERCSNTWVPLRLPAQTRTAVAWDPVRNQLVTLVGRQTWLWDGTEWTQRFPAAAPLGGVTEMVTDTRRSRVVTFVGGQTWEWDGLTWLLRATTGPANRSGAALAYDPVRGVVVLFGGDTGSSISDETWEWNGVRWARRAPAHAPSPRFGAAMAWDPSRARVVLVGGTFDHFIGSSDTWEFDGVDWVARALGSNPPPRYDASLTWDETRGVLVLIAGTAYDPLDDIWELSSSGWVARGRTPVWMYAQGAAWDPRAARVVVLHEGRTFHLDGQTLTPVGRTAPSNRSGPAVTWDPVREQVVLFGGYPAASTGPLYPSANDTWVRDATSWTELAPGLRPPARYGAALTWDAAGRRLLLFGGSSQINSPAGIVGQAFDDTWAFDGAAWTRLAPAASPPAGVTAGAWDESTQRLAVQVSSGALWTFSGTTWSLAGSGGPGLDVRLVFDPQAQRLMALSRSDTWAFSGGSWARLRPATALPSTSRTGCVAWDPSRRRVILQRERETWAWDGSDWAQLRPTAQPFAAPEALVFDSARSRLIAITQRGEWTLLP